MPVQSSPARSPPDDDNILISRATAAAAETTNETRSSTSHPIPSDAVVRRRMKNELADGCVQKATAMLDVAGIHGMRAEIAVPDHRATLPCQEDRLFCAVCGK